ncbi:MAG: hypothetical protein KGL39_21615 [Patescibacteria group bacterium]|nr:hypothetical protein [Patescibacteria group bacterium]
MSRAASWGALLKERPGHPARRVWTTADLATALGLPPSTAARHIAQAVCEGWLIAARQGLYLNAVAVPTVTAADLASHLRAGAVVSLQTVLGDCGVYNNPTAWVTAVLPVDTGGSTAGGVLQTAVGTFQFRRLGARVFHAGAPEDRLDERFSYPRATPEKALVDWLALAHSPRSTLTAPPAHDLEIELLDLDRLQRLAKACGLADELSRLVAAAHRRDDWADEQGPTML